jgi:phage-related protein
MMHNRPTIKPLHWIGSSRKDIRDLPEDIQDEFGHALLVAQMGGKHETAKPLKGFSGAGVLEVVEDYDGNTYRAVYTVRFVDIVYVLHVFQKKSKKGISTPQEEMDKIRNRLKMAEEFHRNRGR